jgi:hypothetical protein
MKQLYIYAALFCLEYAMDPHQIDMELRIYQMDDVMIDEPETTDILKVMQKIRDFDVILSEMKQEEEHSWI